MKNYIEHEAILVPEIALLFLCKTATKKTLTRNDCTVYLDCEIDEQLNQMFYSECRNLPDAIELEKNCVEALNY